MKLLGQADSNAFRECDCTNCTSLERLVEAVLASAFNTYQTMYEFVFEIVAFIKINSICANLWIFMTC